MKLLQSLSIRAMSLRNRIVMAPMQTNFRVSNPIARGYYVERAKGGVGLIMPGAIPVDPFRSHKYVKSIQDWIVDPVHRQGAKIGVQLWHGNLFPCGDPSGTLVAPSAGFRNQGTAEEKYHRELAEEEIRGIISTFVLAAVNAREAGFDMVELHGAHGYLLHQFFSPVDNWRMDGYGGDLRRRMRVGLELAQAVRKAVGDDFPIFFRISAEEMRPGGITLEESIQYAQALETVGIDCIDVSFGPGRGRVDVVPGSDNPEGTFVHMAEKIKKRVHVPVIAVGSIRNPEFAEAILEGQKADLVAMGRQLLADPYWVKKVSEGRNDEIRRCIRCNNCIEQYGMGQPVSCAINASTGREESFFTIPAEQCKRVLVVGGGPAGMEAASVASGRGHKVILAEKSDQLGGQLRAAAAPPHKDEIGGFIDYQIGQLKINGVEIRTGRSVTTADIEELKPQVVVVATGSEPAQTRGPGVGKKGVVNAVDILLGRQTTGKRAVIVGGGMVGCETAHFLAARGISVTVIEMLEKLASDMLPRSRELEVDKLRLAGVAFYTSMKAEEITDRGVKAIRKAETFFFEADTIIQAVGMAADDTLARALQNAGVEVHLIGDAAQPRKIIDAVREGAIVGRQI